MSDGGANRLTWFDNTDTSATRLKKASCVALSNRPGPNDKYPVLIQVQSFPPSKRCVSPRKHDDFNSRRRDYDKSRRSRA